MKRSTVLACERILDRSQRLALRCFGRIQIRLSQEYWKDDPELEAWAAEQRAKYPRIPLPEVRNDLDARRAKREET